MYKKLSDAANLAPGDTEIWYQKPDFFGRYGKGTDPQDLSKTHILLGTIGIAKLETIFGALQGENWSPNGEARQLIQEKGLAHTSMSCGDIAVIDGTVWLCAAFGWDNLNADKHVNIGDTYQQDI